MTSSEVLGLSHSVVVSTADFESAILGSNDLAVKEELESPVGEDLTFAREEPARKGTQGPDQPEYCLVPPKGSGQPKPSPVVVGLLHCGKNEAPPAVRLSCPIPGLNW